MLSDSYLLVYITIIYILYTVTLFGTSYFSIAHF